VADVVPKSIVYRLLAPTMELDEVLRISCREDKLERLLADLAIQRLDLVISDSPMPNHLDIKGYSQKLGECGLSFFATHTLAHSWKPFPPACTMPAVDSRPGNRGAQPPAALAGREQVQPRIVGEFDDSA
jgi:LysR family transcriptional activator of nhaA